MAEIVLAPATSHTPQLSVADWRLLQTKDETDPGLDYPALLAGAPAGTGRGMGFAYWEPSSGQ